MNWFACQLEEKLHALQDEVAKSRGVVEYVFVDCVVMSFVIIPPFRWTYIFLFTFVPCKLSCFRACTLTQVYTPYSVCDCFAGYRQAQSVTAQMKKERDYHRLNHRRIAAEKNRFVATHVLSCILLAE